MYATTDTSFGGKGLSMNELDFLAKSSHLLAASVPSISRHLSSLLVSRARESKLAVDNNSCPTCCTIQAPGRTCIRKQNKRIVCLVCRRSQALPAAKKPPRKKPNICVAIATDARPLKAITEKNTLSKTRKKVRSQGLAALLVKKPAPTVLKSGLSLADFTMP